MPKQNKPEIEVKRMTIGQKLIVLGFILAVASIGVWLQSLVLG